MLTRASITTKTLARAARQAQLLASRKSTSADDRDWCAQVIASVAELNSRKSQVAIGKIEARPVQAGRGAKVSDGVGGLA